MKPKPDDSLDRLFKAAAQKRPAAETPAFGLETRVIAAWREASAENEEFAVAWFRRAAIFGCVLAVASVAWSHHARTHRGAELAVADSIMSMGVEP